MSAAPSLGIPELAGIATYRDAARIGYPVDENVRRLLRYHWVEKRLMEIAVAHLPATPEWEVKCALALHQWHDIEHAHALRQRITEMRSPAPPLESPPDRALDDFLEELIRSADTIELLAGIYRVAKPALVDAYRRHLRETNALVDHPTHRILRQALDEEADALVWGGRALSALLVDNPPGRKKAEAWQNHLAAYLEAAGGIAGDGRRLDPDDLPEPRAAEPFVPEMRPRRDHRFEGTMNFNFPPHVVYALPGVPADERNLALLCKRALEMDVPEMMASILTERRDRPWEFYRDYSRQLWDEARHAMMGTVALEARGIDWTRIPLNISFALRLNLHADARERQLMLYAIEQSLMPGETGKRSEYETAKEAGDALSAHFHDHDWADEVLHAQIGRRWLKDEGISPTDAVEQGRAVHERTWAALDAYRAPDEQREWWDEFVQSVLGRPSAAGPEARDDPSVVPRGG